MTVKRAFALGRLYEHVKNRERAAAEQYEFHLAYSNDNGWWGDMKNNLVTPAKERLEREQKTLKRIEARMQWT